MPHSNIGRWRHTAPMHPGFGQGPSYWKAMNFLRFGGRDTSDGTTPLRIEDWGCGLAGAKAFAGDADYVGVDGSPGYADVIADLVTYRSNVDCILLRHVLEHNREWAKILDNAVASFGRRLCIIVYTPFTDPDEETHVHLTCEASAWWDEIPEYRFNFEEFTGHFSFLEWDCEIFPGEYPYQLETMFFISRNAA